MKRSLVLALSFVLIVGVVAGAVYESKPPIKEEAWDNLPDAWKFNFTTFGEFGASIYSEAEFQIAGYIFTEESAKRFYKDDWPEPKDWVDSVLSKFSRPVNIYVYSYGNSTEPFDPAKFTFSQYRDSTEYSVDSETGLVGFESGDVMRGMVDVPSEINAKESFYIHYEYDSAQVYRPTSFTSTVNPYTGKYSWESEEEETKTDTSEETGYDIQEYNYDFKNQDYEDYDSSWRLGLPWVEIANGELAVSAVRKYPISWSIHPRELSEGTRIEVKTEGKILDGDGSFGIILGYQENENVNFHAFFIKPKRKAYLITRMIEGTWRKGDVWKSSSSVEEGINQLRLEVSSHKDISFYINDTLVKKLWGEDSYKGGKAGVIVSSSGEERIVAGFDYFKLKTYQD